MTKALFARSFLLLLLHFLLPRVTLSLSVSLSFARKARAHTRKKARKMDDDDDDDPFDFKLGVESENGVQTRDGVGKRAHC